MLKIIATVHHKWNRKPQKKSAKKHSHRKAFERGKKIKSEQYIS